MFEGWPEQAFDVLLQLEGEPSEALREELRKDRENLVRQPMIDLLTEVAAADAAYEDFSVWSYATMVSMWQRQSAIVRIARCVEIGVSFDLDGLHVRGAWWYPDPGQVDRYRAAVAAASTGPELERIVRDLDRKGLEISGDQLKRGPRGYSPDHPRFELLRYRSLFALDHLGCEDWLHTPEPVDRTLASFTRLRPFLSWLADNVPQLS